MKNARRLLVIALGLGLFGGVFPAMAEGAAPPSGLTAGTRAPKFMLPVVNGDQFTEARRWGPDQWVGKAKEPKKLVIMSFFATYCEPCKKEMPELVRLYETYKDQGLGVMLVSIDKGSDKKKVVVDLAAEHNVTFPVMHDRFQVVARRYKAERLPYMLMINPKAVVKTVHVGYTEDMKAGLENEVRAHLGLEALPAPVAELDPEKAEPAEPADDKKRSKKKKRKKKKRKKKKST